MQEAGDSNVKVESDSRTHVDEDLAEYIHKQGRPVVCALAVQIVEGSVLTEGVAEGKEHTADGL